MPKAVYSIDASLDAKFPRRQNGVQLVGNASTHIVCNDPVATGRLLRKISISETLIVGFMSVYS